MKSGHLYVKNRTGEIVKKVLVPTPNQQKIEEAKERIRKYFNTDNFYIDASEFYPEPNSHE